MSAGIAEKIREQLDIIDKAVQTIQTLKNLNYSDGFLGELSKKDGQYGVAYMATPEPEPQIPSDAELEKAIEKPEVKELEKRFDLEQTGETPNPKTFVQDLSWELLQPGDERFAKIVGWVITSGGNREQLEKFQTDKKIRFTPSDFDHLRNLIWYREELMKGKEGAFSLQNILSQSDTTEAEKPLWAALAKTVK